MLAAVAVAVTIMELLELVELAAVEMEEGTIQLPIMVQQTLAVAVAVAVVSLAVELIAMAHRVVLA
jgi:hypothetical protein